MRVVIIGAILAFARHCMADLATPMEKLMGKAFMPAVATPQDGSHMSVHTKAPVAPADRIPIIANFPESNPKKGIAHLPWGVFKLEETNHHMKTEREGFRSQIVVTSPLTHAQTMPIDAHWRTLNYGFGRLGCGIGAVFLLSIIRKIYLEWKHRTPVVSMSPLDGAEFQSSAGTALPLSSCSGGLRTAGVVMSESEGPGGGEAKHNPEQTQAGSRSEDVKMQRPRTSDRVMPDSVFDERESMSRSSRRAVDHGWPGKVIDGTDSSMYMSPPYRPGAFDRERAIAGPDSRSMSPPSRGAFERGMPPPYRPGVDHDMRRSAFAGPDYRNMSPPYRQAFDRGMAPPYRPGFERVMSPPNRWAFDRDMRSRAFGGPDSSMYMSPPRPVVDGFMGPSIREQGRSLRTWSFRSPYLEQVQVMLSTDGRAIDASIELWNGPQNTPAKMRVHAEDGNLTPFNAMIATPRGPNTVAIRNNNQSEFPLAADVVENNFDGPSFECFSSAENISGGVVRTFPVDPTVDCVQVFLQPNGKPLNAKIELLQGPSNEKQGPSNENEGSSSSSNEKQGPSNENEGSSNEKQGPSNENEGSSNEKEGPSNENQGSSNATQIIELSTDGGLELPFLAYLLTPGPDNVVRIANNASVEFAMTAAVVPDRQNVGSLSFPPQR